VLPNIESPEELVEVARLLYKTTKAVAALPSHWKQVNDIVKKNMRLGGGITGIFQALDKISWLSECYEDLRKYDVEWSAVNGWNKSIKLTTIKPSGTLSLLAGVTPGIHPALYRVYIRRVRMSANDPLVEQCRVNGYRVEYVRHFDGSTDYTTVIVEFPCKTPNGTKIARELTPVEHLEYVKLMQTEWSDNAVSCTVYYAPDDIPTIQEWLKVNYEHSIKSVSFLLRNDHGFDQAPYEEISEDEYEKRVREITSINVVSSGSLDLEECQGGSCPVK